MPFGALVALGSEVLVAELNTVLTERDSTQHAELRAVSRACRELDAEVRCSATLYASTEPCAMCCGALYWGGLRHVVFGLRASRLEDLMGGVGLRRPSTEVLGYAAESVLIEGPILEDEALAVHSGYWQA